MARSLVVLGTAVFAGCLFPSFDDLGGTGQKGKTSSSSGDAGTSGSSASSGSGSSSGQSSGQTVDAGSDPNAPGVQCGTTKCPAEQGCCTTIGGPTCEDRAALTTCPAQIGDTFLCDGNEDCGPNQVCCVKDGDAACADDCAGTTLCNAPLSKCPAGKSCTGTFNGFKACQ